MYIIDFLTRLLVASYRREARRVAREAEAIGRAQAAEALEAVELAKQADAARAQSVELGIQKRAAEDQAVVVAARADRIEELFGNK